MKTRFFISGCMIAVPFKQISWHVKRIKQMTSSRLLFEPISNYRPDEKDDQLSKLKSYRY